jgi:tRNA U34 5-carboxymethylaminomethyl modifying GTPase MnmE/TrmE
MRTVSALVPLLAIVCLADDTERSLKLEFDDLAAKAAALIQTVNEMEQHARENGQTLSPDLLEHRALVQSSIDRAAEALQTKDLRLLRERLNRARGQIERLRKMV